MKNKNNVIVIVGPTCSGKSYLALKLAEDFNTEIISADSRQFYKYLNIGTAKPTSEELKRIKHHFIGFLEPDDEYNVSKFEIDAERVISALLIENRFPIVAGGSGLYLKALIDGIAGSADADEDYRNELNRERKEFGNEFLFEKLRKADPESASKMLPQNWKRVIRALEVIHLTGEPIWRHHRKQSEKKSFSFSQIGLIWDRQLLYENINRRVDSMIEKGLVNEVENILSLGYPRILNSLNTLGYKEIINFLEGSISLDIAIELIKRNTRHYAKRQLTWFRRDSRIQWFEINSFDELINIKNKIIQMFS
jgi:tRNA dimethylallyltransferase